MTQTHRAFPFLKFIFKWFLIFSLLLAGIIGIYVKLVIIPDLPDTRALNDIQLQTPLSVFSKDGLLIAKFGEKKRIPILYADIPQLQVDAFIAAEDKDFFQHSGVDFMGLARAATQLVLTGEKRQGGSTITMQVARNFFLSSEKTYLRKLREILISFAIEQQLSKQDILSLYLNKIYLGHRSYGIAAAAEVYYGKKLEELSLAQQAMIASLPKAPSSSNPITNPDRALARRNYVLNRLLSLNYINQLQFDAAVSEPITARVRSASSELEAPYVAEMVRDEMFKLYGDEIYTSGMFVYTTIDSYQQNAANLAIRNALHDYDKRHGYRGILGHVDLTSIDFNALHSSPLSSHKNIGETLPALVTSSSEQSIQVVTLDNRSHEIIWQDLKWAWPYINENKQGKAPSKATDILSVGDIIRVRQKPGSSSYELAQVPDVTGALVALNPTDGALTALVGGYDYYSSKFNRAVQSKRQPGSGFKPILYTAALSKGYTAATLINDAPVVFNDAGLERQWRPENYSGQFFGPTRLREALVHSRNLVSIRILRDIGVSYVRNFATRFGFNPADLPKNLSLSLGSGSANPYTMATAYSVFANGGFQIKPYFIDRFVSYSGEELFQANPLLTTENDETLTVEEASSVSVSLTPLETDDALISADTADKATQAPKKAPRVISPQLNFLANSLLRDVVSRGTGRRALSLGRTDLAGKTGTTNDQRDAWFSGFNPSLVAVAWVGFDNSQPLGNKETGGHAALPIWIDFMSKALEGTPNIALSQPDGIVGILIDPNTGFKTDPANPNAIFEYFRQENVPALDTSNHQLNNSRVEQQQVIDDLF